jgi:uncharacterized coiled-coil protein SlyX
MKTITSIIYPALAVFALACLAFLPKAQAVSPAPDGGYPGGNTAEGQNALLSLTTGGFNTGIGFFSLRSNTAGQFNTAVGAGTLLANIADQNTATGAGALLSNTTGDFNTANGAFALFNNSIGGANAANGGFALFFNTIGNSNTANGDSALLSNTTGNDKLANGLDALYHNTTGSDNTATGFGALFSNTSGSGNIALGSNSGSNVITANNVICIGATGNDVNDSCFIGNIFGKTSPSGLAVFVNSNGRLGTSISSQRFKQEIKRMGTASEAILALKPVSFRYKKEIDPAGIAQFRLVAEEVEKVNPDLVVRDKEGKPYSVRYDQVNAMLLNEFLKEHSKVKEQQATIAELKSTIAQQKEEFLTAIAQQRREMEGVVARFKEQDAKIQRVSAQLELNKPRPQTVSNNR